MATFDDFNFGDDSGAVDTDPVPDNDNLDANQSTPTDGEQDDTANYPEPGQDDRFEGGEPSEFDVQGNPNEPGAQIDHTPPESNIRQMFDAYRYRPVKAQSLDERLNKSPSTAWSARGALGGEDAPNIRQMLDEYTNNPNQPRIPPTMREMLDAARHAEQDVDFYKLSDTYRHAQQDAQFDSFYPRLTFREIADISAGMPSSHLSYEELGAMWQNFLDTGIWYPPQRYTRNQARRETAKLWSIGEREILNEKFDFIQDAVAESDADDPLVSQYGDLLDATAALILIPDSVINDIFDDQSMIALLEEYNNSEASWGRIDGQDDFANTIDNPSGVGELFDQLLVSGNDAFMVIDSAQDVDGLVSSDFLSMDAYVEEMDIRDYVGDLTLNSDIIEFQNMGTNVLEDFDGVL